MASRGKQMTIKQEKGKRYPFTPSILRDRWVEAKEKLGSNDLTLHGLRRTRITRIIRKTGNPTLAQTLVGHSDIATTMRYNVVGTEDVRTALEKMAAEERKVTPLRKKTRGAAVNIVSTRRAAGDTAKARKGTATCRTLQPFRLVDPRWAATRIVSGLSSGEGLIAEVRDATYKAGKEGAEAELLDPGVDDKRLMVIEPEFASALQAMQRQGNTLSPVMRNAWDGSALGTLTKTNRLRATDPHISMIAHITSEELKRHFTTIEMANGLGNRLLWFCARRSKLLAFGGSLDAKILAALAQMVGKMLAAARQIERVTMAEATGRIWEKAYEALSEARPGLLGGLTARSEAQAIRLAIIYALCDGSSVIQPEHLTAAMAVVDYNRASIEYVFGDALGDPIADTILAV